MMGVSEEELYNLPTAEYVNRRGFLNRELVLYHVAFHGCADLRNVEVLGRISDHLLISHVKLTFQRLCVCVSACLYPDNIIFLSDKVHGIVRLMNQCKAIDSF